MQAVHGLFAWLMQQLPGESSRRAEVAGIIVAAAGIIASAVAWASSVDKRLEGVKQDVRQLKVVVTRSRRQLAAGLAQQRRQTAAAMRQQRQEAKADMADLKAAISQQRQDMKDDMSALTASLRANARRQRVDAILERRDRTMRGRRNDELFRELVRRRGIFN